MTQKIKAYRRVYLRPNAPTIFAYVLHYEQANFVQIGLGYESRLKLNLRHVAGPNIHERQIDILLMGLREGQRYLDTGPLAPLFDGAPLFDIGEENVEALSAAIIEVAEEGFGAKKFCTPVVPIPVTGTSTVALVFYDLLNDMLKIAFSYQDGDGRIAEPEESSYSIQESYLPSFIAEEENNATGLIVFGQKLGPCVGLPAARRITGVEHRAVLDAIESLAERVWGHKA